VQRSHTYSLSVFQIKLICRVPSKLNRTIVPINS
jgi:hypothetical protein